MNIKLVRIGVQEVENLWNMQMDAFKSLLEKYQDFGTSPGAESKEKIKAKLLKTIVPFVLIKAQSSEIAVSLSSISLLESSFFKSIEKAIIIFFSFSFHKNN